MDHLTAGEYWNGNAEAWTKLARAGYDVFRDHLNTPGFLAMLPPAVTELGLAVNEPITGRAALKLLPPPSVYEPEILSQMKVLLLTVSVPVL